MPQRFTICREAKGRRWRTVRHKEAGAKQTEMMWKILPVVICIGVDFIAWAVFQMMPLGRLISRSVSFPGIASKCGELDSRPQNDGVYPQPSLSWAPLPGQTFRLSPSCIHKFDSSSAKTNSAMSSRLIAGHRSAVHDDTRNYKMEERFWIIPAGTSYFRV